MHAWSRYVGHGTLPTTMSPSVTFETVDATGNWLYNHNPGHVNNTTIVLVRDAVGCCGASGSIEMTSLAHP
jgi:hypothetical protein